MFFNGMRERGIFQRKKEVRDPKRGCFFVWTWQIHVYLSCGQGNAIADVTSSLTHMRSKLHMRIEKIIVERFNIDHSKIYIWETCYMLYFAILSVHRQAWFALNVYCFTKVTQIMFCLALSHIVVYCDKDIVYRVPYHTVCIVIHPCTGISFWL